MIVWTAPRTPAHVLVRGCCPAHPVWLVSCCAGDGGYLQVPAQPSSHDQSSQVRGREQTAPVM